MKLKKSRHHHLTSFQIIILGFLGVILTGSFLLMLPFATQEWGGASFADALFTSTSAVCVTGLVVKDTATYWSLFGQAVILFLIQIGGMGVITVAVSITSISGKRIGLMQRSTMQDAISAPKVGGIVRLTVFIVRTTFIMELVGAVFLYFVFSREFGWIKGIWYSLFHSVSAFCNAGFDLIGVKEPFSSLSSYASQPLINVTIISLIVMGGIGFLTWDDIRTNRLRFKKYRMQSKVILTVTAVLILFPALYFFFFEFQGLDLSERFWCSLFQSVTPRTAGFNTADLNSLSDVGKMMTILLMLIGGSPGSTAGGMKTTTIAVLSALVIASFRQRKDTNLFRRRIPESSLKNAATIFMLYLVLFLTSGMLISSLEKVPILTALFEAGSAIGTVGLSLGITPDLCMVSRGILVLLMFFGRVGGLTLIFAAVTEHRQEIKYPQEKITVG